MKLRGLLWLLLLVAAVMFLARPRAAWTEVKRSWARREWIVTLLLIAIVIYLVIGFYRMYEDNTWQQLRDLWQ